jgi:hypothetical protein
MIIVPDLVNGLFELFGGVFVSMNIYQLYNDKKVNGIHWGSSVFFTSWGIWNIYYYPFLGQWLSFCGGIFICVANIIWFIQRIYYRKSK